MAARGNRSRGGVCVGVALFVTLAAALGFTQPALAQEAPPPPPPAESVSTEATPTSPPPADAPPAGTSTDAPPAVTAPETSETTSTPASDEPAEGATTDAEQPAADGNTTEGTAATAGSDSPPASDTSTAATDAVKLEPEAPAAPAAPALPATGAATPAGLTGPAAAPLSSATAVSIVLEQSAASTAAPATAADATAPRTADADGDGDSGAEPGEAVSPVVSFKPRAAIALLPDADEATPAVVTQKQATMDPVGVRAVCAQPHGLVPLSSRCEEVVRTVAVVVRGGVFYPLAPGPEVRAAIDRGAARAAASRARAAPPPKSKAAKERPIPKIRPILPFGGVALGALQDGFGGVAGSASSSRIFALATVPLRVPRPFTLARLRLPSTTAHGALAATPPTRPG